MVNFIAYIPFGYPDTETTLKVLRKLEELGIYGVELGIPFSDPIADGPVIQKTHTYGTQKGISLKSVIDTLKSEKFNFHTFIMSYLNPITSYPEGLKKLTRDLKSADVEALVIPDLPLSEWKSVKIKYKLVPFVAPNTREEHLEIVNSTNPPFIYYIARYGTTGERNDLPYKEHIKQVREKLKAPLFVGFGISSPETVKKVLEIADGVIVGSAIVKEMLDRSRDEIPDIVSDKVRWLLKLV